MIEVLEGEEREIGAEAIHEAEDITAKKVPKLVKRHQTTDVKISGTPAGEIKENHT